MGNKSRSSGCGGRKNPVARHAYKVNRSVVFKDRTQYRRKTKHKGLESFAMPFPNEGAALQKVSPSVALT